MASNLAGLTRFGNPTVTLYRLYVTSTVPIAIQSHRAAPGAGDRRISVRTSRITDEAACWLPAPWRGAAAAKRSQAGRGNSLHTDGDAVGRPRAAPCKSARCASNLPNCAGRVPSAESRPRGFCPFDADSALGAVPEPSLGTAFGAGAGAGALGGGAAVGATPAPVQAPSDPRWLIGLGPGLYRPPPDDISACDGHSMHIGPSRPERKSLSRVVAARSTSPAKRVSASRCR